MLNTEGRHSSTIEICKYFDFEHLPERLQVISMDCAMLAKAMLSALPDGPELTMGLRKLLEAKDCFVRQALNK